MPQSQMPSRRFLTIFCGLALALNAFSCDMLLPAFFAIEADLGGPIERVQAVIPIFLAAAGLGQIVFGPLSDRYGRRPVMAAGLVLYISGATAALLSPDISTLLVARAVQGLGSSCGIVVARAILRDSTAGKDLAAVVASTMAIFALGPIVAPLVGVLMMALGGWRGAFASMAFVGCVLLVTLLTWLGETNKNRDPRALEPRRLASAAVSVVKHPQSRHFLLVGALMSAIIVSLVANSPRVFKSAFGIEGLTYAVLFAITAAGIIAGQMVNSHLIGRFGVLLATRSAAIVLTVVNVVLALLALSGGIGVVSFTVMLLLFNASFVVVLGNCMSMVLEPHRNIAGLASSLFGSLTQLSGSAMALFLLPVLQGNLVRWSLAQAGATLVGLALILAYRPAPRPAEAVGER
ncbi:MAG: multidrug effflux MFS transporter [Hyphomicrobiales bacterium]|nr:multidrug effflux MFS transporter [Hyphomicrobiales bacterium]